MEPVTGPACNVSALSFVAFETKKPSDPLLKHRRRLRTDAWKGPGCKVGPPGSRPKAGLSVLSNPVPPPSLPVTSTQTRSFPLWLGGPAGCYSGTSRAFPSGRQGLKPQLCHFSQTQCSLSVFPSVKWTQKTFGESWCEKQRGYQPHSTAQPHSQVEDPLVSLLPAGPGGPALNEKGGPSPSRQA